MRRAPTLILALLAAAFVALAACPTEASEYPPPDEVAFEPVDEAPPVPTASVPFAQVDVDLPGWAQLVLGGSAVSSCGAVAFAWWIQGRVARAQQLEVDADHRRDDELMRLQALVRDTRESYVPRAELRHMEAALRRAVEELDGRLTRRLDQVAEAQASQAAAVTRLEAATGQILRLLDPKGMRPN